MTDELDATLNLMEDLLHAHRRERIVIKDKQRLLDIYNTEATLLDVVARLDEAKAARIAEASQILVNARERQNDIRRDIFAACAKLAKLAEQ